MLDAVKQLLPLDPTPAVRPAQGAARQGGGVSAFEQLMDATPTRTRADRPAREPADARIDADVSEWGEGWQTADLPDDEDLHAPPTPAGTAAAQASPDTAELHQAQASPVAVAPTLTVAADTPAEQGDTPAPQARLRTLDAGRPPVPTSDALPPSRLQAQVQAPETVSAEPTSQPLQPSVLRPMPVAETSSQPPVPTPVLQATAADATAQANAIPADQAKAAPTGQAAPAGELSVAADPQPAEPAVHQGRSAPRPSSADSDSAGPARPMGVSVQGGMDAPNPQGPAGPASQAPPPIADPPAASTVPAERTAQAPAAAPSAANLTDLGEPNLEDLAGRTVRWQRLGVLGNGQGEVRIRLQPPELGSVQVALRSVGDAMQVQFTVETEAVRLLLQGQSDRLRQSLQSHGLAGMRVEVLVQTAPAQADTPAGQDGQPGRSGRDGSANQDTPGRDSQGQPGQDRRDQPRSPWQTVAGELNLTA